MAKPKEFTFRMVPAIYEDMGGGFSVETLHGDPRTRRHTVPVTSPEELAQHIRATVVACIGVPCVINFSWPKGQRGMAEYAKVMQDNQYWREVPPPAGKFTPTAI